MTLVSCLILRRAALSQGERLEKVHQLLLLVWHVGGRGGKNSNV